jgi:hypothetical protein
MRDDEIWREEYGYVHTAAGVFAVYSSEFEYPSAEVKKTWICASPPIGLHGVVLN